MKRERFSCRLIAHELFCNAKKFCVIINDIIDKCSIIDTDFHFLKREEKKENLSNAIEQIVISVNE